LKGIDPSLNGLLLEFLYMALLWAGMLTFARLRITLKTLFCVTTSFAMVSFWNAPAIKIWLAQRTTFSNIGGVAMVAITVAMVLIPLFCADSMT